jgi:hypothetical protein
MKVSTFLQYQIKAGQGTGYQNSSRTGYRLPQYLNLQSSTHDHAHDRLFTFLQYIIEMIVKFHHHIFFVKETSN